MFTTHKCSYYCNPPIHASETLAQTKYTEQDIKEYIESDYNVVEVVDIRQVNEVDEGFINRASQGVPLEDNVDYTTWLVTVKVSDTANKVVMESQNIYVT
jgi:hypothetical protein